jgi:hypothetical protein
MLGVNIVDENIANDITTIRPEAIMQIQVLANKPVGFFMENLEKLSI